jgi:peptidoglycan/LPS O-acetylase OafA/YrhL
MVALHVGREIVGRAGVNIDYALFLLGSVITFVIAELSFRFYEKPIIAIGKRFK